MTEIAEEFSTGTGNTRNVNARGHIPGDPSMWFFVIGDLIIFSVYFVSYMYYRGQDQDMFLQGHAKLNLNIGAVNTVVLVTSSLFVALGTAAARAGKTPDALRLFGIALACGAAFPLLKLFEYIPEITAGMTPSLQKGLTDGLLQMKANLAAEARGAGKAGGTVSAMSTHHGGLARRERHA